VGETGLQLLRYGVGEARLTGALRTDGIFRGLGGLFAGQFTTTQRDAITSGSRPYGLSIFNVTTNRYEMNIGTDASPNWVGMGRGIVAGDIADQAITYPKLTTWPSAHMKFRAGFGAAPDLNFRLATGASTLIDQHNGTSWIVTPSTTTFAFPTAGTYLIDMGAEVPNQEASVLGAYLLSGAGAFICGARGTVNAGSDPSANIIRTGITSGARLLTVTAGAQYKFGGYWGGGSQVDFWVTAMLIGGY
jgi:hypothetical protein